MSASFKCDLGLAEMLIIVTQIREAAVDWLGLALYKICCEILMRSFSINCIYSILLTSSVSSRGLIVRDGTSCTFHYYFHWLMSFANSLVSCAFCASTPTASSHSMFCLPMICVPNTAWLILRFSFLQIVQRKPFSFFDLIHNQSSGSNLYFVLKDIFIK